MAGSVKFFGGLQNGLRAERSPGVVTGEQGLWRSPMISLGGGLRDQVAFDLDRLVYERDSVDPHL